MGCIIPIGHLSYILKIYPQALSSRYILINHILTSLRVILNTPTASNTVCPQGVISIGFTICAALYVLCYVMHARHAMHRDSIDRPGLLVNSNVQLTTCQTACHDAPHAVKHTFFNKSGTRDSQAQVMRR